VLPRERTRVMVVKPHSELWSYRVSHTNSHRTDRHQSRRSGLTRDHPHRPSGTPGLRTLIQLSEPSGNVRSLPVDRSLVNPAQVKFDVNQELRALQQNAAIVYRQLCVELGLSKVTSASVRVPPGPEMSSPGSHASKRNEPGPCLQTLPWLTPRSSSRGSERTTQPAGGRGCGA
jgi:hypothetical protein